VTAKHVPPPSGDVHDYVSLSIYWWPDPASAGGTPYIQRDGVRNPEADDTSRYDANPRSRTVGDVELLSLAYYLAGDERYARHAVELPTARWSRVQPTTTLSGTTCKLADFALLAGDVEVARQVLSAAPTARIDTQIATDGSMPRELERTRSFHYSNFNLQAFAELATLGQLVDVDLGTYKSAANGASIRRRSSLARSTHGVSGDSPSPKRFSTLDEERAPLLIGSSLERR
jgi:hypothetical protein